MKLEMIWHCNYYDGPLSGVARYNEELVWFDVVEAGGWITEDECEERTFQLYRLSKEDMDETIRRHELFRDMVGHHSDHLPNMHSDFVCKDKDKFNRFYEMSEQWKSVDIENAEKLGIFTEEQFKYYARPR